MLYALHEYTYYTTSPLRSFANLSRDFWGSKANPASDTPLGRTLFASSQLFSTVTRRYGKPEWGFDSIEINGKTIRVHRIEDWASPWCKLIRFERDASDLRRAGNRKPAPAVLIVTHAGRGKPQMRIMIAVNRQPNLFQRIFTLSPPCGLASLLHRR